VNREMSLLRGEVSRGSGVGASLEPRREARDQACWRHRYRHDPSAGSLMSANLKHRGDKPPKKQQWGANVETRGELVTGILHPRPAIAASFVAGAYRVSGKPIRTIHAAIAASTVRSIMLAAPTDQPDISDRMMGSATWAGR
jgi:hypothetical protein